VQHDPSVSSYYVSDAFYRKLVDDFADWQTDEAEVTDLALRDSCRRLLEKEARLLDQDRLGDWLALYAPECLYWVPATPHGGDPRREIAVCFDDRRRLEDRLFRLDNEFAWSQKPRSRTARLVGNVTVYATADDGEVMVRSTFYTSEFQAGDWRKYTGWYGHRLRDKGDGWEILVKQVNLIDCDQNLRNLSVIL
jgi:3-phenylpropionate/cinnamic acid dioxygenase small subunit